MEKLYNPYDNVLKVVKEAADILSYTDSDIEAIKYPERELKVAIPVRMDDGTTKVFEGYRGSFPTLRALTTNVSTPAIASRVAGYRCFASVM